MKQCQAGGFWEKVTLAFLPSLLILSIFFNAHQTMGQGVELVKIIKAEIVDQQLIEVVCEPIPSKVSPREFFVNPSIDFVKAELKNNVIRLLASSAIDLTQSYTIRYHGQSVEVQPDRVLNTFVSDKPLGCVWNEDRTIFRVFAPRASNVTLVLFDRYDADMGVEHEMMKDAEGVWEVLLPGHYFGMFYGYRVDGPHSATEMFDATKLIADPYSRAVVTMNEYLHRGKSIILDSTGYDWEGDTYLHYKLQDLIIYECHVRDMTAHASSGVPSELAGSYRGFLHKGIRGGLEYIKTLGVNAVEFLPIHEFGNIELPFGVDEGGVVNTWNPYERNHWGYMTSYFFAPESYYASGATLKAGDYSGADARQVNEFKDVIKALHRAGIAVIMDVVYNHVSQYDQNCFKYIDKKYYFRLNPDQTFIAASGCGNDFKTERPMARRLIVDSIKYWMQEYHVDGFRFDLAAMIDWETVDAVAREARKINPHVILIAEPWGGGKYEPAGFSQHDWAAWNDQFRNGIKGQNPENGQSFIFGQWWGDNNLETVKRYIMGDLKEDGGLFARSSHAVNYLESHDDYTFGDFVRIGNGDLQPGQVITDIDANARLSAAQMALNKLGALLLFTSQGPVMIAEGQEFARSKVIAKTAVPDDRVGQIDHNSYNKDNATNWLNFQYAEVNRELVDYYRGLIALRKNHPAFRLSPKQAFTFFTNENPFVLGFLIDRMASGDSHDFLVCINAHRSDAAHFDVPPGRWSVVVDDHRAGDEVIRTVIESTVTLPPSTGLVLRREN